MQIRKITVFEKAFLRLLQFIMVAVLFTGSVFAAMDDTDFIKLCEKGSLQQIVEAIENGANVNAWSNLGVTPIMSAAEKNFNPRVVRALINAGADVNVKNADGMTPLIWSTWFNSKPAVITTLLELGADPKARDNSDKMAIDYARENGALIYIPQNAHVFQKLEEVNH
jgi:ankyrin repeat protein